MRANPFLVVKHSDDLASKRFLAANPDVFIEYYSGLRLIPEQRLVLRTIGKHRRLVILLPRGHGKSTLISKWRIIYEIAVNPNVRIILVMKNDREVGFYARSIRKELASNRKLILDWGPFLPQGRDAVWSNDAIEVYKREITESQPTVEFASAQSIDQVLGHRCDKYFADDIVTPKTVNTEEMRQRQLDEFNEGLDTGPQYLWDVALDENGEWVLNGKGAPVFANKPDDIYWPDDMVYEEGNLYGTVFHPQDLYHAKARSPLDMVPGKLYVGSDPAFRVMYFDCWKHDPETNEITDTPLWPARWSKEKLREEERSKGTLSFNRRYRNIAVDESQLVFPKQWITGGDPGCLDYSRSWGELPDGERDWQVLLGFDPSSGRRGEAASWSTFVVLAVDRKEELRKRYMLDVFRAQMGFDDIVAYLAEGDPQRGIEGLWTKYHYDLGIIEQNAAQRWLLDYHKVKAFQVERGVRLIGWETQVGNKLDPVMGVASMQAMVRDGLLSIPYRLPSDRDKATEFIEQMALFPQGTQDYPMALWFAYLGSREQRSPYRSWCRGPHRVIVPPSYEKLTQTISDGTMEGKA